MNRRNFFAILLGLLVAPRAKKRIFGGRPYVGIIKEAGLYSSQIQSIKISCPLSREEIFELGRKGPYHKFINFPVEISETVSV